MNVIFIQFPKQYGSMVLTSVFRPLRMSGVCHKRAMVEVQKRDYEIAIALKKEAVLMHSRTFTWTVCYRLVVQTDFAEVYGREHQYPPSSVPALEVSAARRPLFALERAHHLSAFCEAGARYLG